MNKVKLLYEKWQHKLSGKYFRVEGFTDTHVTVLDIKTQNTKTLLKKTFEHMYSYIGE